MFPMLPHTAVIPDKPPTVDHHGLVTIRTADRDGSLSLMLYTEHARALRDALNALDLDNR